MTERVHIDGDRGLQVWHTVLHERAWRKSVEEISRIKKVHAESTGSSCACEGD